MSTNITGCSSGKRPYRSKGEARAAIGAVRARRGRPANRKMEQRAYLCACGCWHITSQSQP